MPEVPDPAPDALWHATPLAGLPTLLLSGRLLSRRRLCLAPVTVPTRPRPRVRRLAADDRVHLSPTPRTPFLADRLRRGIPCALLRFDPDARRLPGAALVRFNGRAWAHRDCFAPVTDPAAAAHLWDEWRRGRFPSLECVVPDAVPLQPLLDRIELARADHRDWVCRLRDGLSLPAFPCVVAPEPFAGLPTPPLGALDAYADVCLAVGTLLPPPDPYALSDSPTLPPGSQPVDTETPLG